MLDHSSGSSIQTVLCEAGKKNFEGNCWCRGGIHRHMRNALQRPATDQEVRLPHG
jgi:hypothetical protein